MLSDHRFDRPRIDGRTRLRPGDSIGADRRGTFVAEGPHTREPHPHPEGGA